MLMKTVLGGFLALVLAAGAHATKPQPWVDAEVRKVQPDQGKVTLKHGPIENLDMPGMTMTFRVANAADLAQLAPGDKVKVVVMKLDGYYTVTSLERVGNAAVPTP